MLSGASANLDTLMPDDDRFLPDYLLYMLASVSDAASAEFHTEVRAAGIRVPEWRVFGSLVDEDGMMLTTLARIALVEQSAMTKIISQMEDKGLVTRKGDHADKRRVRVYLTKRGRFIAERLVADARAHEYRLLEAVNEPETGQIKDALRLLMTHFGLDRSEG